MKHIRNALLLTSLLTLSTSLALADGGGITGKVAERSSGKPIVGARVSLSQPTPQHRGGKVIAEIRGSADADINGTYVLNDIPTGSYDMVIQAEGYAPAHQSNVVVTSGQSLSLDVALDRR